SLSFFLRKVYLKYFRTFDAYIFKFFGILFYFFVPKRHHFRKFLLPFLGFCLLWISKMQEINHNIDGHRSTRRSAQKCCDSPVFAMHHFCSKFKRTSLLFIAFYYLHTLSCNFQIPICVFCVFYKLSKFFHSILMAHSYLLYKIFCERNIMPKNTPHRRDIVPFNAFEKIKE